MSEQGDATLRFFTGQQTADAKLLVRVWCKSATKRRRRSEDANGAKGPEDIQIRTVQHVVPFQKPTGHDVVEGGADSATTLVKVQDPNFLKPSGTCLAQPLRNTQANPTTREVSRKVPQEGKSPWIWGGVRSGESYADRGSNMHNPEQRVT